ncbi:MAG: rod shape-determining protein, partial [Minisyncoccota bacterium]
LLSQMLRVPVYVANDPLTAVARGAGIVLENMDEFKEVLIEHESDLPPR